MQKKIIIILLASLLFNSCSSKAESKVIDLKDCSITFPSDYSVKLHKDKIIDSLLIKPTNLINGMYIIYYDDDMKSKNGNFMTLLNSYSNHISTQIENLELIEATDTHMKAQIYFLIGEHFYISFVKYNDDIKNVIRECNQSWR